MLTLPPMVSLANGLLKEGLMREPDAESWIGGPVGYGEPMIELSKRDILYGGFQIRARF